MYRPIDCSNYDRLELWATKQQQLDIHYLREDGATVRLQNVFVKDLYTRNKEEFLVLDNDVTIRLDRLLVVNDIKFTASCSMPITDLIDQ